LHGILLPQFLLRVGIEPTPEAVQDVKLAFKKYLKVNSTASLSDSDMSKFIGAVIMLASRNWGIELTEEFAEKTMRQVLKEVSYGYF